MGDMDEDNEDPKIAVSGRFHARTPRMRYIAGEGKRLFVNRL